MPVSKSDIDRFPRCERDFEICFVRSAGAVFGFLFKGLRDKQTIPVTGHRGDASVLSVSRQHGALGANRTPVVFERNGNSGIPSQNVEV